MCKCANMQLILFDWPQSYKGQWKKPYQNKKMRKTNFKSISLILLILLFFACKQEKVESEIPTQDTMQQASIQVDTVMAQLDSIVIAKRPVVPDYDTTLWTDIELLDSTVVIDIKYATEENFVGTKMYECGRCFLRPEVAKSIHAIQALLQEKGLGLKMYDCFRPRPIQFALWEKVPDPRYVSNPEKGSMHNRGAAVDLTLVTENGEELEMGTPFDYFGREAYHTNQDLPEAVLKNRKFLKETMESHGFRSIRTEWWHYSYTLKSYALSDMLWKCY